MSQAAHFIACMVFIALMAFITWPSSHGRHRMASLCLAGQGCSVHTSYPCPKLLTSSPSWSSSHGPHRMAIIAWLHRAWQGEGARLTSQKAAAPAPTPRILVLNSSLHRLHGLHRSHGLDRMALIVARRLRPRHPRPYPCPKLFTSSSSSSQGPHRMASLCLAGPRVLG